MVLLLILIGSLGAGCIVYYFTILVQEWLHERKSAKYQVAEYIRILTDENEYYKFAVGELEADNDLLRQQVREAMGRELSWIDERKRLIARVNFAMTEMALDDNQKKTQVITK